MQSHGVRRLWIRILLAVQERNHRSTLSESIGLHILGHQALVEKEEVALAAWHTGRCASHDRFSRRNCCARHDYRFVDWHTKLVHNQISAMIVTHQFKFVHSILGIPVWVGRKLHSRYKGASRHKRNSAVMGGVAASVSWYRVDFLPLTRNNESRNDFIPCMLFFRSKKTLKLVHAQIRMNFFLLSFFLPQRLWHCHVKLNELICSVGISMKIYLMIHVIVCQFQRDVIIVCAILRRQQTTRGLFFIIKALTISSFLPFFLCLLRRHLLLLTLCLMISQVSIEGRWLFLRIACLLIYTVKICHQRWVYYSISMTLFHHSALIWKTYYINNSSKNFTRPRPFLISTLIRILCI